MPDPARTVGSQRRSTGTVRVGSIDVSDVTAPELMDLICAALLEGRGLRVFYANAHAVRLAADDPAFSHELARADVIFPDGQGIKLATRLLGRPLRVQIPATEWVGPLLQRLGARARVYLVGDEPAVVNGAADHMRREYPLCTLVGAQHGFFPVPGPEHDRIIADIVRAAPSILLIGMGMPRQERWANLVAVHTPDTVLIAVGALFRRLTGLDPRPPRWINAIGLEWLVRLSREPIRLFDRYVIGLPRFATIVGRDWCRRFVRRLP